MTLRPCSDVNVVISDGHIGPNIHNIDIGVGVAVLMSTLYLYIGINLE